MKTFIHSAIMAIAICLLLCFWLGIPYATFKLVFWAGSPKYVAVICGICMLLIVTTFLTKSKK